MTNLFASMVRVGAQGRKPLLVMMAACVLGGCSATLTERFPASPRAGARAEAIDIPPGHMPPPGECRIWFPGRPPGHQPPSGDCRRLEHSLPPGAWLLYRPDRARRVYRID